MELVFIENDRVLTDSLTVAEAFGKEHKRVMQDIRELGCSEEFGQHNFVLISYKDSMNRDKPKYLITQDGFALLVMGYTGQKAMSFKEKYIAEFNRMRDQLIKKQTPALPQDYKQALIALVAQVEENEKLQTEKLMLEQRVAEYEPKITYLDQILQSKDTVTITQIAKDYGLSGRQLNKILHEEKIQFKLNGQWLLYKKHQDSGYTKSQTVDIIHTNGERSVKMNTRWTQKGRLFLHDILTKRGVIANIDREQPA